MPTIDFTHFSQLIADTPAQIRRQDVYRLLDAAHQAGALKECVSWLREVRPDLRDEAEVCVDEILR